MRSLLVNNKHVIVMVAFLDAWRTFSSAITMWLVASGIGWKISF